MRQEERLLSEYVKFMQLNFAGNIPTPIDNSGRESLFQLLWNIGEKEARRMRTVLATWADMCFYQHLDHDGLYRGPEVVVFKDIHGWNIVAKVLPVEVERNAWVLGKVEFTYKLGNYNIVEELHFG